MRANIVLLWQRSNAQKCQLWNSLLRPIHIYNSVDDTKLSCCMIGHKRLLTPSWAQKTYLKKKITKDQCTCTGRKGNLIHAEWYSIIIIIIIVIIFINYHYYYYHKFVSLMRWLQICNRLHVARWKGVVCTLSSGSQHFFILVIVST